MAQNMAQRWEGLVSWQTSSTSRRLYGRWWRWARRCCSPTPRTWVPGVAARWRHRRSWRLRRSRRSVWRTAPCGRTLTLGRRIPHSTTKTPLASGRISSGWDPVYEAHFNITVTILYVESKLKLSTEETKRHLKFKPELGNDYKLYIVEFTWIYFRDPFCVFQKPPAIWKMCCLFINQPENDNIYFISISAIKLGDW